MSISQMTVFVLPWSSSPYHRKRVERVVILSPVEEASHEDCALPHYYVKCQDGTHKPRRCFRTLHNPPRGSCQPPGLMRVKILLKVVHASGEFSKLSVMLELSEPWPGSSLRSLLIIRIIAIVIVITDRNRNRNRNVNGNVNGIGNCNGNGSGIHLSVSSISEAQDPSNRFDALEILTLIVLEARWSGQVYL